MSLQAQKLIAQNKKTQNKTLDLGNCGLTELPPEVLECVWVETLILSSEWWAYDFEKKESEWKKSQNEGKENRIVALPADFSRLSNLRVLVFQKNPIQDLSPLSGLSQLQILNVTSTQVSDLSPLYGLSQLQRLRCSDTQVSNLSPLFGLSQLRELDCSSRQVSDLSPLSALSQLQYLGFSFTQVSDLSPLSGLLQLQILNCSSTQVSDLSPLAGLSQLQKLYCSSTQVNTLSPLSGLSQLQVLSCSSTQVGDLSPLAGLVQLQQLFCSNTQVSNLSQLSGLIQLQELDCYFTQVTDLSPLSGLMRLEGLDFDGTQVSDLSPLSGLEQLQILNCSSTQVSDLLPIWPLIKNGVPVKWEVHGHGIMVGGCPLTNPPVEIVQQGNEAILNYFNQVEEQGTIPLYEAKLIMVGEPGAGKTSLTEKLWDENHQVIPDDPAKKSTLGINIRENWRFEDSRRTGELFTSHIWDFGGQEIQYMTHQFFLTPESLYVLVADDRKQHTLFPYWFEVIHLLGKDDGGKFSPIIVVLNERNHKSITNFDLNEYRLKYPQTRIEVVEVDLGDDNLNRFTVVKNKIQQALCSLDHIGRPLPALWPEIRDQLLRRSTSKNHINEAEFSEICENIGVKRKEDQYLIGKYLHQLGVILHFQNDRQLRDFIVISPKWALKAVYAVLEDKEVEKNGGRFTDTDLDRYWSELSKEEKDNILGLMMKENFEICYKVEGSQGTYIAPQLLPQIRPAFDWEGRSTLKCHFFYRFMPKGIITRLIVRKNTDLKKGDFVWAKGAVFQRFDCDILVTEEETERNGLIAIEVNGRASNRVRALDFIRNEIEEIHRKWFPKIGYEERAPCNCEHCANSIKPTFFNWEKLIQRMEEGRSTIECDYIRVKDVPVLPLIEGYSGKERIRGAMQRRHVKYVSVYEEMERHLGLPENIVPADQTPIQEEITPTPSPSIFEKMNLKIWLPVLFSAFMIALFLAWAKPGSKLDFFGWFVVEQGDDTKKETPASVAAPLITVVGSIKINGINAKTEEVTKVYLKGKTLIAPTTLSGNIFKLSDVEMPQDKIIQIALDLKDVAVSPSALFKLPAPNKDNVSDLGEVLIEVTRPKPSKSNGGKASPPIVVINNTNMVNVE